MVHFLIKFDATRFVEAGYRLVGETHAISSSRLLTHQLHGKPIDRHSNRCS